MEAEIRGLLSKLKAIRDSARRIRQDKERGYDVVRGILNEYNDTVPQFDGIRMKFGFVQLWLNRVPIPPMLSEDAILNKIEIECEGAIGALENIAVPLPKQDLDNLSQLRKELRELSAGLPNIYFEKNIEEAIKECEQTHFLASALISSRVIVYTMEQITGKSDEDKIKTLVEGGAIDKERRDIQEVLIKASRMARNFLSHDIKVTPSPSDALSLVSDAVRILKLYYQLLNPARSSTT